MHRPISKRIDAVTHIVLTILFVVSMQNTGCKNGSNKENDRTVMVSEVQRLKQAVLKRDKKGVASFFDFPIKSDQIWYATSMSDTMSGGEEHSHREMSKDIFLKEADRIILNVFTPLFSSIGTERLADQDTVSKRVVQKNEPCMNQYSIFIEDDSTILFELRMDKNPDYQLTEKDIGDDMDFSSLCEHQTWWRFKLRNGRLMFASLDGAD